jgi:hypothetical protein
VPLTTSRQHGCTGNYPPCMAAERSASCLVTPAAGAYAQEGKSDIEVKKSEAILVRVRGGLKGCEMLRIPHYLDNRLTDGCKFFSPMHRPSSTPQKRYFSASGTHFC